MIKNLLGKKDQKNGPEKDVEVQKLRDKFNNIVNTGPEQAKTGEASQKTVSADPELQQQPGFEYVDPGRVADNERITNLIMQQIKELIEIDNNLNAKIKELETKLGENSTTLASTKHIVEQFDQRLDLIEKNMEKFMGLYEIVTNRFNPFVTEEQKGIPAEQAPKETTLVEDAIPGTGKTLLGGQTAAAQPIEKEAEEIIDSSGLGNKLDSSQQTIVKDELEKAIGLIGEHPQEVKTEIADELGETIGKELQEAMAKHIKLSNEDLKNTMKEMLLEAISHIRQSMQAQAAAPQQKPQPEIRQPSGPQYIHDEVHPDFHFYLPDGTPIKSIKGLSDALKTMDEKTFKGHVSAKKNDFAEWIRVVLKKDELAEKIAKQKTRQGIQKVLTSLQ